MYIRRAICFNLSSGSYYTHDIRISETCTTMNVKSTNPYIFAIWHDILGHPRFIMTRKIIENSNGHPLKNQKILQSSKLLCDICSQCKLIIVPLVAKSGNRITYIFRMNSW